MAKKSRSNYRKSRKTNRKNNSSTRRNNMRRNNMRRMMYGGESMPGSVSGNSMAGMTAQSLAQGQQFAGFHKNQHGGAGLDAGPFPGAVVAPSVLPENLHASARVAPLDAAIKEIQGLRDQDGGARKRKNRKGSRKGRKGTRKGRKGQRKGNRKSRRMYYGGSYSLNNAQSVNASGMLLSPELESKALGGMNAEWKLAEDPKAFAPGYKTY